MKKTFKQLREFNVAVRSLYERKPEVVDSKLGYAIKRFTEKNIDKAIRDYSLEIENMRVENALTDEKTKALLKDFDPKGRGYLFDKAGMKEVMAQEFKIIDKWDEKEFEVEPHICKEVKFDLSQAENEAFKGLVI